MSMSVRKEADGQRRSGKWMEGGRWCLRETLDQLELGGDLAALLGDLLLGTVTRSECGWNERY